MDADFQGNSQCQKNQKNITSYEYYRGKCGKGIHDTMELKSQTFPYFVDKDAQQDRGSYNGEHSKLSLFTAEF